MNPGIYTDLSGDDYHAAAGISKSGLDWIAKCPALYRAKYITKEIEDKETSALSVGRASHLAVFQPEIFDFEIAVTPDGIDRRTKAGKEAFAEFLEASTGKTVINRAEHDQVRAIADAVHRHPIAMQLLKQGQAETSIFSLDSKTGELVKVRPDWMAHHEGVIVDLKTAICAAPDYFSKEMYGRRYYVQAPYYLDIANSEYDHCFESFVFIVAEKEPPYLVEVYLTDMQTMDAGRQEYRRNLDTYHHCKESNKWPCYNGGKIQSIGLPAWAIRQVEMEIAA
jgi:exodeoxyribonuclease VIII